MPGDDKKPPPLRESRVKRIWNSLRISFDNHVRPHITPVSFITLHYAYFIITCLIASLIFWGSSTPFQKVRYIDSVFLAVSAMTEAGLNTVNLSTLNTWQQVILFLLIIMGSSIFVSIAILHIRKVAFERRLEELAERKRRRTLRTLTMSFTKRRDTSQDEHEEAVASGVIRGQAIQDPEAGEEYHPSFLARARTQSFPATNENEEEKDEVDDTASGRAHIRFENLQRPPQRLTIMSQDTARSRRRSFVDFSGVAVQRTLSNHPSLSKPVAHEDNTNGVIGAPKPRSDSLAKIDKYLDTVGGYIGRNSRFHHLSDSERRQLGGLEYDALCALNVILVAYLVLFQLIGALGVGAWLQINRPSTAYENGLNPFWTGMFFAVSAFNNSGMALLDANAVALQTSYYCLLTLSLLILAGNTCFPPFLRLIVWTLRKMIPPQSKWHQVFSFILDHPRRVYTNLFPSSQTWWLVASLVVLNGVDWIAFEVLNIGNPVTDAIQPKFRVLDGLFQAFAVRCGGFYVVPISSLYPGLLVLYVIMMYISAFPVTMTIRNTNVYEERSLGIFAEDEPPTGVPMEAAPTTATTSSRRADLLTGLKRTMTNLHGAPTPNPATNHRWSNQDFVRAQLRGQLGHDLWWLCLAIFLITVTETSRIHSDPVVFSIFNIIFEVVSAYGTVGISVGVPWNAYSFCGAWQTGSKLVLCAVMLRGRHRGLPVAIDRAVLLPSETLSWAEEEDARSARTGGRRWMQGPELSQAATQMTGVEEMEGLRREKRRETERDDGYDDTKKE